MHNVELQRTSKQQFKMLFQPLWRSELNVVLFGLLSFRCARDGDTTKHRDEFTFP